jgi:ATP-dependent helicase YprA (DUF1998 family)
LKDEFRPSLAESVRGYRGGCRAAGEIERRLRDGEIPAGAATNAPELGIDIGSFDAVVMVVIRGPSPRAGSAPDAPGGGGASAGRQRQ